MYKDTCATLDDHSYSHSFQFSFDDEKTEDAFSSNIDPATLGPPPEWGTTSFMPPLDAPAAEPPPPVATTNTTTNTDDILVDNDA